MAIQIITDYTKVELLVGDVPKVKIDKWQYYNPLSSSTHLMGSRDLSVPFFGYGKYSVDVWLEEQLQQITQEFVKHGSLLMPDTRIQTTAQPQHDHTYKWHWERLPAHEFNKVLELYEQRDIDALMQIHDTYKLSKYIYCCGTKTTILNWYKDAIDKGTIQRQDN